MIPVVSRSMGMVFRKTVEKDGIVLPITDAVLSFYYEGTKIDEMTASITVDGVAEIDLAPADVADWDNGRYRADWAVVAEQDSASLPYQFVDYFTLADVAFSEVEVTTDEVLRRAPYLVSVVDAVTGVVGSGATTTNIPTTLREVRGFPFVGAEIMFTSGNLDGLASQVTAYTPGTITVSPALTEGPASGDRFQIRRGISDQIKAGLDNVRGDLAGMGITEDMIVDLNQVKNLVLDSIVAILCFLNIKERDDVWTYRFDTVTKAYSDGLARVKLLIDTDADLEPNITSNFSQVRCKR